MHALHEVLSRGAVALICTLAATTTFAAEMGDVDAGAKKAQVCHACHGIEGISVNELWPNLAGQHYAYLVKQTTAFRSGARNDPSMSPFATNLSDEDIRDISAHYAAMPYGE